MEERDRDLVERARNDDDLAFRTLVERHGTNVFRTAVRVTGNRQAAEDVVQETFLKVYRQLRRFDGRARFSTWLYRIAMNCAIDQVRKDNRRSRHAETGEAIETVATHDPSQERLLSSTEIAGAVRGCLAAMSPSERAAFVLRHYEGRTIAEIAQILGVRTNACKSTIFRAVQKLRAALQPLVEETP